MDFGPLPVTVVRLVNRTCDEFENAWREGRRPAHRGVSSRTVGARAAGAPASARSDGVGIAAPARRTAGDRRVSRSVPGRRGCDPLRVQRGGGHRIGPSTGVAGEGCVDHRGEHSDKAGVGTLANGQGKIPGETDLGLAAHRRRDPRHRRVLGTPRSSGSCGHQVASELLALRDADVEALQLLFGAHRAIASIAASDPRVRASVRDLLASGDRDTAALLRSPELGRAASRARPLAGAIRVRRLPHPRSAGA